MQNPLSTTAIQTMSSTEIAKLTGKRKNDIHQDIKTQLFLGIYDIKDGGNLHHEKIQGITIILDNRGYWKEVLLDHEHTLTLMTGYDVKARHTINKRWIELESSSKQRVVTALPSFEEALKGITVLADYLRLSNVGRIALVKPVVEQYGINAALPDYVNDAPPSELSVGSSKPVSTASALLKQHGITMSAVKFNQQLHQHGVIEQLSRKSSKGVKNYWSIADGYLEYGKNDTSTSNPLEVQIHWYIHKFGELLDLVLADNKAA